MARLSTHVLDTVSGRPAGGVPLELYRLQGMERTLLKSTSTNSDGRTDEPLLSGEVLPLGTFELIFRVANYFRSQGGATREPPFLDEIAVRFGISEETGHYHVPLLVSPYSYSTYRGS